MGEKLEKELQKILKTQIIAKEIFFFDRLESTQIKARELAEEKVANGSIVITDNQTNGIGTHDRKWYSMEGRNITFTLIIYPTCDIKDLDGITIDIAKCMTQAIYEECGHNMEIKYPNDIICNGKKLGGILTQIVTSGKKIRYLLIGIGINVNGKEFPIEIKDIATSLEKEFGNKIKKDFLREKIVANFCSKFENYCKGRNIIER